MLTRYRIVRNTLVIDLGTRRLVLSSAPRGGGLMRARYILSHQVHANPVGYGDGAARTRWSDPARDLGTLAAGLGLDRRCVGLMTAVPMHRLVTGRIARSDLWVEGFVTVGVSNAVKAGEPVARRQRRRPAAGTINIILVTNARLSNSALVGAVQVATEAKTAALLTSRVCSRTSRALATGTGTDAVVIVRGSGPRLRYSGTHTLIGSLIARVVARTLAEGLHRVER